MPVEGVSISAAIQTPSNPGGYAVSAGDGSTGAALAPGAARQELVAYDLREEGGHVLAVTVTYGARTFKKLYQFVAQQCIMVRTKAGALAHGRAVLEAQLENLGERPVALERVVLKSAWRWAPVGVPGGVLRAREVMQVAFVLEGGEDQGGELGVLSIAWRAEGGGRGFLRTGRLVLPAQ